MTIFNVVALLGGLALFLYGMNVMGDGLKKVSGGKLELILQKMTANPIKGVLLGLIVTAIIQSSSATTVMVVGFVNSGIMELSNTVGVIMGANIGTTVTSWILSLTGIKGDNIFMQMLEPSFFSPVMAFIGIILIMFAKSEKKSDTGSILIGFAILMTGMSSMSAAVAPLSNNPDFAQLMTMFSNPILGLLAGTILTAIIQSSSASVGILQALCATGTITYSVALPIIMGQNIGTCITAILSAIGANRNSKRTALIHLFFNVIGTIIFMVLFYTANMFVGFSFLPQQADEKGIAIIHSCFNIFATVLLLPFSNQLVRLAYIALPVKERESQKENESKRLLDIRFLEKPAFALQQSNSALKCIFEEIYDYAQEVYEYLYVHDISEFERMYRKYEEIEDEIEYYSEYLVKISSHNLSNKDKYLASAMLHQVGELKGIITLLYQMTKISKKMGKKELSFSKAANDELSRIWHEVDGIFKQTRRLLYSNIQETDSNPYDLVATLKKSIKKSRKCHIERLQNGKCSANTGIIFLNILSSYEQLMVYCINTWDIAKEQQSKIVED